MLSSMALDAQPPDLEWLRVVIVVHLRNRFIADRTRLALKSAALERVVGCLPGPELLDRRLRFLRTPACTTLFSCAGFRPCACSLCVVGYAFGAFTGLRSVCAVTDSTSAAFEFEVCRRTSACTDHAELLRDVAMLSTSPGEHGRGKARDSNVLRVVDKQTASRYVDSMGTKVYVYGAFEPHLNLALVQRAFRLANDYQNVLVGIERDKRKRIQDAQGELPSIAQLKADIDNLTSQIETAFQETKKTRARTREGKTKHQTDKTKIAALRATRKEKYELLKKEKQLQTEALKPLYEACEKEAHERALEAREQATEGRLPRRDGTIPTEAEADAAGGGLFWGTYCDVEAAVRAATSGPEEPKFKRFAGAGRVAVQLQKTPTTAEVLTGGSQYCQIDNPSPEAWATPGRPGRRMRYTTARIRVGSNGRAPIWTEFHIVMHRPLPVNAQVVWARLVARKSANRTVWSFQVTVKLPDLEIKSVPSRVCALNLGWRKVLGETGDEIRAAYWQGSDGESGEVRLPKRVLGAFSKAEELQGIRSNLLDVQRALLIQHVALHGSPHPQGDILTTRLQNLSKIKSPGTFSWILRKWSAVARPQDLEALEELRKWEARDIHLWRYQTGARECGTRHRRAIFNKAAYVLSNKYDTIVLDAFDLRDVVERAPDDSTEQREPQHIRTWTAPSELRDRLQKKFSHVIKISKEEKVTITCHVCQSKRVWDKKPHINHTCADCGATWDQDLNACQNLMSHALVILTPETRQKMTVVPPPKPAAFAKRHKKHSEAAGG